MAPKFKVNIKKYKHDTKNILDKLLLISITPNERRTEKLNTDQKIISSVDNYARWVFISLLSISFPERIGYEMLSKLQNKHINDLNINFNKYLGKDEDIIEDKALKNIKDCIQLTLVELLQSYSDLGSVDKIENIEKEIDNTKKEMNKNVNSLIKNLDDLDELQIKTDQLKEMALQYKNETKELKKVSKWGNRKMTIVVGGISCSAILLIILKFFI